MRADIDAWRRLLHALNARSAFTAARRFCPDFEIRTDASLSGWGWASFGEYGYGAWPAVWRDRIGMESRLHDI